MLHFFSKNEYLVDHLSGFIDIHNHIIPGIDDGAKNVVEAAALIKAFGELGIKDFICTPHIMSNYYDNSPKTIKKAFKTLEAALAEQRLTGLTINYAAEHMIDANFETILEDEKVLPLNASHLLIEMSYLQPSINFERAINKILEQQLFPVFAHPERYVYLHNDFGKYTAYKQMGMKFQLNVLSLFGYYGKGAQKTAHKLLKENLFDYLATDTHGIRHITALKEAKIKKQDLHLLLPLISGTIETFKQ